MSWARAKRMLMAGFAVLAIGLGLISDLWYLGMINQWLIPWSSLAVLAGR